MNGVFDASVFDVTAPTKPRGAGVHALFSNVRWTDAFVRSGAVRPRGAKRAGLDYERKVIDVLAAIYGTSFTPAPVIRYSMRRASMAAIPDGILRLADEIFILEVKLAHTERVWEQLMERYLPLVRVLEPQRRVRTVEICRSYDPAVQLPGPHTKIESLHKPGSGLEVLQWRI
jgi:hypothetical protein